MNMYCFNMYSNLNKILYTLIRVVVFSHWRTGANMHVLTPYYHYGGILGSGKCDIDMLLFCTNFM